jgi:hypothetical protein
MFLIAQTVHILPCSNSAMKGINGTSRIPRYCSSHHYWTSHVSRLSVGIRNSGRIVSLLTRSPNVNSPWCGEEREGPYHTFPVASWPGLTVVTPSFKHLSITFSNHHTFSDCSRAYRGCSISEVHVRKFLCKRIQDSRMFSPAVACAVTVARFFETDLLNVRCSVSSCQRWSSLPLVLFAWCVRVYR